MAHDGRLVEKAAVLVRWVGRFLSNEEAASLLGELVSPLFKNTDFLPIVEEARASLFAEEDVAVKAEPEVAESSAPVMESSVKAKRTKGQAPDFIEVNGVRLKRRVIVEMAKTGSSCECPVAGCGDIDKPEKAWIGQNCFSSGRGRELISAVKKAVLEAGGKGIILSSETDPASHAPRSQEIELAPEVRAERAERLERAKEVVLVHLRLGGEAHLRPGTFAKLVLRGPAKAQCTHGLLTVACAAILEGDAALREKIEKGMVPSPAPAPQAEENLPVGDDLLQRRADGDRRAEEMELAAKYRMFGIRGRKEKKLFREQLEAGVEPEKAAALAKEGNVEEEQAA